MKTKFIKVIPLLLGVFLLMSDGVFSQTNPESQKNFPPPDLRYLKKYPDVSKTLWQGKTKQQNKEFFKEVAKTNDKNSSNVRLIGRWGYGPCYGVATDSNYVYFGNGAYFEIAALKDTTQKVLGKVLLPSSVNGGIIVKRQYAYVADSKAGLRIIDIKDITHPKEAGSYNSGGWAMQVTLSGNYAYVLDQYGGLRIVDISNPLHPLEAGHYKTQGTTYDVSISGNYAYVADGGDGLRIIDVSNPAKPKEIGFLDTAGDAESIDISGDYAYVADGKDGLRIIDISNPAKPKEVGFFDTAGEAESIDISGDYAYVADGKDGLRIIDVRDTVHIREAGFFDTGGDANAVSISGQFAYVADAGNGLRIIDVSDTAHLVETGFFRITGNSYKVAVSGGYAYLNDDYGIHIIDLNDSANLSETGYINSGYADGLDMSGHYVYETNNGKLKIIDVNDPTHPAVTATFGTEYYTVDVAVSGKYAYVTDYVYGLRVINVSDPAHPVKVGAVNISYMNTGKANYWVMVSGHYAYMSDSKGGLYIINISDPTHPYETGFFNAGTFINDMVASEKYIYLATGNNGIIIVNISDPSHPEKAGFYDTRGYANDIALFGQLVYVADQWDGLRIINVSDPVHPRETGFFKTGGYAVGVTVKGQTAYVADYDDGMYILKSKKAGYFAPVWSSGTPFRPMSVWVKSACFYGDSLNPGDVIGVFDKDSLGYKLCVGQAKVDVSITPDNPLKIIVSADDTATREQDGFINGHKIYYKIWKPEKQKVFSNVIPVYDTAKPGIFKILDTTNVRLHCYGHFHPSCYGYPYKPMEIFIDTVTLPGTQLQSGDEVGVFYNNNAGKVVCVGAGPVTGTVSPETPLKIVVSANDPANPEKKGFTARQKIYYKVWSKGTKKEYDWFSAKYDPGFDSLFSLNGKAVASLSFEKTTGQEIFLPSGWNIVSFNITPFYKNMLAILNPLASSGCLVKAVDEKGEFVQKIPSSGWINTIGNMSNAKGYYVKVNTDALLQATGKQIALPYSIPLQAGWNLMGYPLRQKKDAGTVLKTLPDSSQFIKIMDEKGGFIQYIRHLGWINTLGSFTPGQGYYIKVTKNTRLTLNKPTKAVPVSGIPFTGPPVLASHYFNKAFKTNPYFPMDIVVTHIRLNGYNVQPGDEVAVFDKGVCVGTGVVPQDINQPILIVASQDDPSTTETDGYRTGDPITFRYMSTGLTSPVEADPKVIFGKLTFSPLATTVCGITASSEGLNGHAQNGGYQFHVYPNPATTSATFVISNPETAKLQITLMDLTGKVVRMLQNKDLPKGEERFRYDLGGLPSGIYNIRVLRKTEKHTTLDNYKLVVTR